MAKIVINIEDVPGGGVSVVTTPSNEEMFRKLASHGPNSLTAAEAYALYACRMIREESKRGDSRIIVPVPRIGRK